MNVMQTVTLRAEDIKPNIGVRVLNSKDELLSGVLAEGIMDLLEQRGVLVFPEVHFTDDEQVAFTSTLGTFAKELRGGSIYKITLDCGRMLHRTKLEGDEPIA